MIEKLSEGFAWLRQAAMPPDHKGVEMNPPGKRKTVADAYFELKVLADAWASAKQRNDDQETHRKAYAFFDTLHERLLYPCIDARGIEHESP